MFLSGGAVCVTRLHVVSSFLVVLVTRELHFALEV